MDHANRKHAKLSASGASRWINCPGSVNLEEKVDAVEEESVYAREGTLAHEFADAYLKKVTKAISTRKYNSIVKKLKEHELYKKEMDEYVAVFTDYVLSEWTIAKQTYKSAELHPELRVSYEQWVEGGFGTSDGNILSPKRLVIADLKYGKGVEVSAVDNSQLKLYALGVISDFEFDYTFEEVKMVIVQPRLDNISEHVMSVGELLHWAEEVVKPKALEALGDQGEVKCGDWCRFCKAQTRCRVFAEKSLEIAKEEFTDTEPALLDDEELIEVFNRSKDLQKWLNKVQDFVSAQALTGKEWKGLKLVEGRSSRQIVDEQALMKILIKHGYSGLTTAKMLGIGALEAKVGKAKFNELVGHLIEKPQGAPTLVPEDDKRPPYRNTSAVSDFEDEEEFD